MGKEERGAFQEGKKKKTCVKALKSKRHSVQGHERKLVYRKQGKRGEVGKDQIM